MKSPLWFLLLFPFAFAGIFWLVTWLLAALGGWRSIAARFPHPEPFDGTTFGFASAKFGPWLVSYNHCLTIGASARGLYVSAIFPFAWTAPAFLVPWQNLRVRHVPGFFFAHEEFEVLDGNERLGRFRLRSQLAEDLEAVSGGAWPRV